VTRDLRLVSLALLLWGVGEGLFFYFQPIYLQQLGAKPVWIGGILGLAGVAAVLTHVPAGSISDRIGSKSAIVASWVMGAVAAFVMFLAPSLVPFVAGLVIYYFTLFVMSPLSSYITNARGQWSSARALTTAFSSFSLGLIVGPTVGGRLAESVGLRVVFAVSGVIFVLSTLLVLRLSPQPVSTEEDGQNAWSIVRQPGMARFLVLILFSLLALSLSWPLTPNYLTNQRNISLATLGVLGSINALGVVVLNLSLGRLRPKLGFALSQVVVGLSMAGLWLGQSVLWYGAGFFLAGGMRTAHTLAIAQSEPLVSRRNLGLAFGLVETMNGSALAIGPVLAGFLYQVKPWLPFPVGLSMAAVTLLLSLKILPGGAKAVPPTAAPEIIPSLRRQ
jgi:MFS family permease